MTCTKLEVCVDTIEGAWIAAENGADRIELCAALSEGGLTPSAGMMAAASRLPVPVFAMIRPRPGDFRYSDAEKTIMLRDIQLAVQYGMSGIVTGAVTSEGRLDVEFLAPALRQSGLASTLHRVFDTFKNLKTAIEGAIDLGFERILTSGQGQKAEQHLQALSEIVRIADGRISIMAGSGVTHLNATRILTATGVRELHASCSVREKVAGRDQVEMRLGFIAQNGMKVTSAEQVQQLRATIDAFDEKGP
ncbi:MAG: copper homeostasis protein CutC [Roseibium sp.]|uniref:copper homeostasis protein CutC n=1 Tax=Roseibium sp. TaxID=1936156 RepID=UPI003D9C4A4F